MSRSPSPGRARSRSRSRTVSPDPEAEACPFLIRVFVTKGKHTPLMDFDDGRFPVTDEFQVYGWKHSTPTSLIQQLYSVFPAPYRSSAARYTFRHVYVDASERGLYKSKDIVNFSGRDFMATVGSAHENGMDMDHELHDVDRRGKHVEEKTLDGYGFLIGDLLSVAVMVPEPRAAPAAAGATTSIRGASIRDRMSGPVGDRDAPPHTRSWGRAQSHGWKDRDGPSRAPEGSWRADPPHRGRDRRESPDTGRNRSRSPPPRRESWSQRYRD